MNLTECGPQKRTLRLERYRTRQPSRFTTESSRSPASHPSIVSCDEAIEKTAGTFLPMKQCFFQCGLVLK